jgi:hypothetical protein
MSARPIALVRRGRGGWITAASVLVLLAACGRPDPVPAVPDPETEPMVPVIDQPGPDGLPPPGDTIRRPTEPPADPLPPPAI